MRKPTLKNKILSLTLSAAMVSVMALGSAAIFGTRANADDSAAVEKISDVTVASKPTAPTKAQKTAFVKNSANFSIKLFKKVTSDSNTMIAPMSVMTALAMTANGADSTTSTEMQKVLAGGAGKTTMNKEIYWWTNQLSNTKNAKIKNGNSIWYRNDSTLNVDPSFLKKNVKYYGSEIYKADFAQSKLVANAINSWVSKATDKMIPSIIDDVSSDTAMYLINAVSFNAKWDEPYTEDNVYKGETFTTQNGTKQKVTMMYGDEYSYISDSKSTGFIKPYKKGYSFVAILPNKGVTVAKYVSSMTGTSFRKLIKNASDVKVETRMPKFTSEYSTNMVSALKSMGISEAFTDNANFTKMSNEPLCIGSVTHKTYIKVNEKGTQAGAVTAISMNTTSVGEPPEQVYLTRPFIYAIVDNKTNLPIFIGTEMSVK
jgi:Serine protease inhibitor